MLQSASLSSLIRVDCLCRRWRQRIQKRSLNGRYDVVCPIQNAWDLDKAWPKAQLHISPASGHSAYEPENVDALVRATDSFAG